MGGSRNGTKQRPEEGERGVSGASSYLGDSLIRYGRRRSPTVVELDAMMRLDPWAEAIEGALTWPIRPAKWSIKEAEGDTGEAEEARRQFAPLASRAVSGAVSAICRRVAFAEQVWAYDRSQNKTTLYDLAFRPADQCEILPDANGRPTGFRQRAYARGRGLVNEDFLAAGDERKAFVFLHDASRRPGVGRSAVEAAYHHFEEKEKVSFYRNKSLEKYGGPTTHAKTDAAKGSEAWNSIEMASRDARSGASVVTDKETEIAYLSPPNAGDAFRQARQDLNFEMAVSAFVQFLALSQEGNSGAFALSRDHHDFLTVVTEGRMAEMAEAFTSGPIYDLTFWNFGPDAAFPYFEFEPLSENVSKRIIEAAGSLFARTGRPMPQWLAEGVAEGYARSLGVEKPEDADPVGQPMRALPAGEADDREEGES